MNRLTYICLKVVWWSSWPLLLVIVCFLGTGYMMSGRFGATHWLSEAQALALHKLLHIPLIALLLIHAIPAIYLGLRRWGWIKTRKTAEKTVVKERTRGEQERQRNDQYTLGQ